MKQSIFIYSSLIAFHAGASASGQLIHGWDDYFKNKANWTQEGSNIYFPENTSPSTPDTYTFFVDKTFFGDATNRVFSGIYSQGGRKNAVLTGNIATIPRTNAEGGNLIKIQAVGGNGNDYFSMCYISVDPQNPLHNSKLYGDKPWPNGDYNVPCAQNVIAVWDGKDILGALNVGHDDQSENGSNDTVLTNEIFDVPEGELSVTLRAPFGYGLTPVVSLVPQSQSSLGEVQIFSADGKWTLPVVAGVQVDGEKYEHQYLNMDDDLTAIHQYKVQWTKVQGGVQLAWYLGEYQYASQIVSATDMPQFKLKIALKAQENDAPPVPMTTNSFLSVFDMRLNQF